MCSEDHGDESGSSSASTDKKVPGKLPLCVRTRETKLNIYLFDWFFKQVRMITPNEHSVECVHCASKGNFRLALAGWCCSRVIMWEMNVMHCLRRKNDDDYIGRILHRPLHYILSLAFSCFAIKAQCVCVCCCWDVAKWEKERMLINNYSHCLYSVQQRARLRSVHSGEHSSSQQQRVGLVNWSFDSNF